MTEDELLAAISDAMGKLPVQAGPPGITTAEIAKAKGISGTKALGIVKELIEAGKLRPVKVRRFKIDGSVAVIAGWLPVVAGKAKR